MFVSRFFFVSYEKHETFLYFYILLNSLALGIYFFLQKLHQIKQMKNSSNFCITKNFEMKNEFENFIKENIPELLHLCQFSVLFVVNTCNMLC